MSTKKTTKAAHGAIDITCCPTPRWNCTCSRCQTCGFGKHTSLHGPVHGAKVGGEPYDHIYVAPKGLEDDNRE